MTNEERWNIFIKELKVYIQEHHLGPSKHTDLYNQCRFIGRRRRLGRWMKRKRRSWKECF